MTPTVGTYDAATYTWEETKYIVYKVVEPAAGIDSPYNDNAATQPFFEFADMQYYETFGDTSSVNIRHSCPITYTVEAGTGATFSTPSLVSGNLGYDGVYRVTLDTASYQAIGTYSITVVGEAEGNSNQFKINFILNLKDYCTEMAVNTIEIPANPIKYSQYGISVSNIPILATDTMTPTIGTITAAPDVWEETKYIVYKNKADPPGIDSPYKNSAATKPYFEFEDFKYIDAATGTNIRDTCKFTYTLDAGTKFVYSVVSGTEGYNGVYRVTLDTDFEVMDTTNEVSITGSAHNNGTPFTIKFILHLKDFCKEMGTTNSKLLGTPILSTVKYS